MASQIPPIVLFGYDSSPFTQKIRLTLRLLQLPYTFVIVPSMMPRPILVDNFSLTYRKIPVLAIGKEIIIDTSLIVEWLHSHPALQSYRQQRDSKHEIHHDARSRVLARLLSSHYTDRPLFRLTTGLIPSVVWKTHFGIDRAELIGHKLDADKLEKKVPKNLAGIDTYLSILEPMFSDCGWVLGGQEPSTADIALYYQLDWGEKISRGEGVENLTGGGTSDGFGEGMKLVFDKQRYPNVLAWFERFGSHIHKLSDTETRIERKDTTAVEAVMQNLNAAEAGHVVLMATPQSKIASLEERIGLKLGSRVSVAPDDTGRDDPTTGTLVASSPEEVVIVPEHNLNAKVSGVRLHFPRVGFVVTPIRSTKL